MNVEKIIILRYLFTIAFGFIFFIGCQVIPATDTKETWTFFEAIIGIFSFPLLHVLLFSQYMYNSIRDEGINISYKTYQILGLVTAFGTFILIANVYILGIGVNY